MFCALLTSRYQVSIYRTNGPLVFFYAPKHFLEADVTIAHNSLNKFHLF